MKKLALAVALSSFAFSAMAGGLNTAIEEPTVTPEMVATDAASVDHGILVPIMGLLMFGAAAAK